jgi:D-beta-D-heptose 7-phosphate kinase / D-beta-D-heptose 1-phosphate adenosyltransferase
MRRGFTSGCFDLIHVGHIQYLQTCKSLCDLLYVGVDSDYMVSVMKGPQRPIIGEIDRCHMIESLSIVDTAIILVDLNHMRRIIKHFGITMVFKHQGFRNMDNVVGVNDEVGAELIIVPDVKGLTSTSKIIDTIVCRYTEQKNRKG